MNLCQGMFRGKDGNGPAWLKDAVFYEIYPQSFQDSNGDGIGDIPGIISRLDYIKDLGCNALWINPCYDSPFKDAGYDVRDYKKVAPRYGTNEDLYHLFEVAHEKGIHVLLDLVPGHTSEEHPWFQESRKAETNEYSDRYIWTNSWFAGAENQLYVSGEAPRDGVYIINFFKCQPALNYGYLHPTKEWQMGTDSAAAVATREALKDIMRFWMSHGCDGFRVDMADSLVKLDDEKKSGTCAVWRNVREMMDSEFPECALVSEWCNPELSLNAGFHMDFYLDHHGNGYNSLVRDNETCDDDPETRGQDHSFFRADGNGDIQRFLGEYVDRYKKTKGKGYISFLTCNHDTPRTSRTLSVLEQKLAFSFFFTMPGVPFLYYGDEIGMRYLDVPTKEGSYTRGGSRTPMQWDGGRNFGFSDCDASKLYLPVDPSADAPTVEKAKEDPMSLYYTVKEILALRHKEEDLQADGHFEVVYAESGKFPFVYRRGNLLLAVNPSKDTVTVPLSIPGLSQMELIFSIGSGTVTDRLTLDAQSFVILK